jgi:hypothetical protein
MTTARHPDAVKLATTVRTYVERELATVEARWQTELRKQMSAFRSEYCSNHAELNSLRSAEDRLKRLLDEKHDEFVSLEARIEVLEQRSGVTPGLRGPGTLNHRLAVLERRA